MASADNNRKSGFNTPAVVLCGLAAIIIVFALSLFIDGGLGHLKIREKETKVYASEINEAAIAQKAEQQDLLHQQPRYLDKDAGVVCMPIEDAMDRVVTRNAK